MEAVEPVSVSSEKTRVWTSPPKRRAAKRVHGVMVALAPRDEGACCW
jgi:hypothetical protein